jgi:hypothetical protein
MGDHPKGLLILTVVSILIFTIPAYHFVGFLSPAVTPEKPALLLVETIQPSELSPQPTQSSGALNSLISSRPGGRCKCASAQSIAVFLFQTVRMPW